MAHYWNGQDNFITEVSYHSKCGLVLEIITQTLIETAPLIYEIVKFRKMDDMVIPIYHGFITKNEDGSEKEKIVLVK